MQLGKSFLRELHGVVHELTENLLQGRAVALEGKACRNVIDEAHFQTVRVLLFRLLHHRLTEFVTVDEVFFLVQVTAVVLCHLQQFVDNLGNIAGVLVDGIQHLVALLGAELELRVGDDLCIARDDVERRADFVADLLDER